MSIQKFPLDAIRKVRQYIHDALILPESEQQPPSTKTFEDMDDVPEPESLDALGDLFKFGGPSEVQPSEVGGRWIVSAVNPGGALLKLPGLRLKPEFRLVSYVYRNENIGKGVIWAVPAVYSTTADLEEALSASQDERVPPAPKEALAHVMDAIEGDRSITSFMIASILWREFAEFGALGKHCTWTHHRLIDAVPKNVQVKWLVDPPKEMIPRGRMLPDGRAAIEFYSCRVTAPVAIVRHIDQYAVNSYTVTSVDKPIATLQRIT